jgi:hypothetical protein
MPGASHLRKNNPASIHPFLYPIQELLSLDGRTVKGMKLSKLESGFKVGR